MLRIIETEKKQFEEKIQQRANQTYSNFEKVCSLFTDLFAFLATRTAAVGGLTMMVSAFDPDMDDEWLCFFVLFGLSSASAILALSAASFVPEFHCDLMAEILMKNNFLAHIPEKHLKNCKPLKKAISLHQQKLHELTGSAC